MFYSRYLGFLSHRQADFFIFHFVFSPSENKEEGIQSKAKTWSSNRTVITINVPLFKKLRDLIFFGGTITLWAISRDILRGPRLFWPLKLSRANYTWQPRCPSSPARRCRAGWRSPPGDPGQGEPLPEPPNYRLAMATFWRTFHHDDKFSPAWVRLGSALYPLDTSFITPSTPSPTKLTREFYQCAATCFSSRLFGFYFARKQLDLLYCTFQSAAVEKPCMFMACKKQLDTPHTENKVRFMYSQKWNFQHHVSLFIYLFIYSFIYSHDRSTYFAASK